MVATDSRGATEHFAIFFALGAPGAGKGTLCEHLGNAHNLAHFSVGDSLRAWMKANRNTPFADRIQQKLDHQGFLTFEELHPFFYQAIKDAMEAGANGIVVDGFPRCIEQAKAFDEWYPQAGLSLSGRKPDVVVSLGVAKENAKERYLARARDNNDSEEKFEKRFAEYESESLPVEDIYRRRGVLIEINANGTKEENIRELTRKLAERKLDDSAS